METVLFDFTTDCGKVKPMHAVNNGPVYKFADDQRITNMAEYKEAGIPYARNHDASFCATYGGSYAVDVDNIFRDFDADEDDPASYHFTCTDDYMKVIEAAGTECYYRLGSAIEHYPEKFHTKPPKDFHKWARICEHIIRHYTEGWANGYHMKVTYWEIWNEPDLDLHSDNKRTWGGTADEFAELFRITFNHLKTCFPHLKIGGPASANAWCRELAPKLFCGLIAPLDFYSWHIYATDPREIAAVITEMRALLDGVGAASTESILNEWNYVRGWEGEAWEYSLLQERGLKGAAFIAATMAVSQYLPLDMLMYYDARPMGMNGMFEAYTNKPLKGYYPFHMFNRLYKLGRAVKATAGTDLYAVAAKNEKNTAAAGMVAHFNDDDSTQGKTVKFVAKGAPTGAHGTVAEYYMLDAYRTETPVAERYHDSGDFEDEIFMPLFSTVLVRYTPVD